MKTVSTTKETLSIKSIGKEAMFKLVKSFAGSVNDQWRDDYFAPPKSIDDCCFVKDKSHGAAALKFKGVEVYKDESGKTIEDPNSWETLAVLTFEGVHEWYDPDGVYRFNLTIREGDYSIALTPSSELLAECGVEF